MNLDLSTSSTGDVRSWLSQQSFFFLFISFFSCPFHEAMMLVNLSKRIKNSPDLHTLQQTRDYIHFKSIINIIFTKTQKIK